MVGLLGCSPVERLLLRPLGGAADAGPPSPNPRNSTLLVGFKVEGGLVGS